MMEIFIPIILIVETLLMELSARRPSVLVILSKMTRFLSGLVNLPLKISQPRHLLLLTLYLLMDYLHVPDLLV